MEVAFCQITNTEFEALQFSQLPDQEIACLRHNLICPRCGGEGYFRAKSRDGKSACFGARHAQGCNAASSSPHDHSAFDDRVVEECQRIYTNDLSIKLRPPKHGLMKPRITRRVTSTAVPNGTIRKSYTRPPTARKHTTKTLQGILHLLDKGGDFAQSDTLIAAGKGMSRPARELCVNFSEMSAVHSGRTPHLFWGLISDTDHQMRWLNTRNQIGVSVPVSDVTSIFKADYELRKPADYEGVLMICYGWVNLSRGGKYYISIAKPQVDNFFCSSRTLRAKVSFIVHCRRLRIMQNHRADHPGMPKPFNQF